MAVSEMNKRFSWRTLYHSSVVYYMYKQIYRERTPANYYIPNSIKDASDPLVDSYRLFLREVVHMHRQTHGADDTIATIVKKRGSESERKEALQSLKSARSQQSLGNYDKALRLLEHAFRLDAQNPDILTSLGEALEYSWIRHKREKENPSETSNFNLPYSVATLPARSDDDGLILKAEHLYTKALIVDGHARKARQHRKRLMPIVEEIDQRRFNLIDFKVRQFYKIPETNPGLVRSKIEHYFKHIYHTNAIEGNTLSLAQTRSILETRLAVGGKSLLEQNEVLGLDAALRFLNLSLARGHLTTITLDMILELHKHVLSFVDPSEAGNLRRTQVFIADHQPPPPGGLMELMTDLANWINSEESEEMHPIELAALTHWKLVFIHPFYDGNGRTARLLMNLILMRAGIPPAIIRMEDRQAYYQHLKTANDGDVRPFIRFIATCTERTIDEYLDASIHGQTAKEPGDVAVEDAVLVSPSSINTPLVQSDKQLLTSMDSATADGPRHCRQSMRNTEFLSLPHVIYLGG